MQSKLSTPLSAGAMASTNTIYSNAIDCSKSSLIGLEISWTSTPNGTLSLQSSHDGSTWYAFTATMPSVAGSAGGGTVSVIDYPHQFLRVKYVNSSSSGVLTIKSCVKG